MSENTLTPSASQQQSNLGFPAPLADKYRPRQISGFLGLEKPRKIMERFRCDLLVLRHFCSPGQAVRASQRWLLPSAKRSKVN